MRWYCETSGFNIPDEELTWAASFALFRDSIIFQGIAARYVYIGIPIDPGCTLISCYSFRYAVRQASNEKAKQYGAERKPFADMAWEMVKAAKAKQGSQAKL